MKVHLMCQHLYAIHTQGKKRTLLWLNTSLAKQDSTPIIDIEGTNYGLQIMKHHFCYAILGTFIKNNIQFSQIGPLESSILSIWAWESLPDRTDHT